MPVLRRSELAAFAIALLALALLFSRAWRIDLDYSIDFQTYWLAGVRVASGHAADLYAPGGGPADGTPVAMAPSEFKNMPLVAVAFAPLALWDYPTAKRIAWWAGLGAIVLAAACVGLHAMPDSYGRPAARMALALAAIAAMAPTHIALRHGQTTPFVAALIALYLAASLRGHGAAAGVALGLACLVKFPPLALVALDAARGRRRTALAAAATIAAGTILSVALFGPELHRSYARGVVEHAGQVMTGHNNQSIDAVAERFRGSAVPEDWTPRPASPGSRIAARLIAALLAAALAWGLWIGRRSPGLEREAAGALALGIVVFPVAWDHYVLMAAPLLVALIGGLGGALAASAVAAYALLALPTPEAAIAPAAAGALFPAMIVSHYFLGLTAVVAVAAIAAATKRA